MVTSRARAAYKHPSKSLVVRINGIAAPVWLFKIANISSEEEEVGLCMQLSSKQVLQATIILRIFDVTQHELDPDRGQDLLRMFLRPAGLMLLRYYEYEVVCPDDGTMWRSGKIFAANGLFSNLMHCFRTAYKGQAHRR